MNAGLESVWQEFADQLRRFIRRRLSDEAETEDVLQDVFLKLARQPGKLPAPDKLPAWLFAITRNAIIDRYRTRKMNVSLPDSLFDENEPKEMGGLCSAVRRIIHTLPEPYREALELVELQGMTQVLLAKKLGISVSGVKSRVQRGRALLKSTLLDLCQVEFDRRGGLVNCEPRGRSSCEKCE